MGLRLLWQPAIAVIVTHDDCVVVFWQINSLSLSLVQCRLMTDGRTDRHTTTAYTALAQRRAVKTDAAIGSPNLIQKCSTMSPGHPFILVSKGQRSKSRVTKHCQRGSLHPSECWLLLVFMLIRLVAYSAIPMHVGLPLLYPCASERILPTCLQLSSLQTHELLPAAFRLNFTSPWVHTLIQ